VADTFNRTTANGWGTASDGLHVWTREQGAAGVFSTTTTPNAQIAGAASTDYAMRLNAGGALAEEFYWGFQADKAPSTGTMDFGFVFRDHSKGATLAGDRQGIYVRMSWTTTAAAPNCAIFTMVDGTLTNVSNQSLTGNFAVNTVYKARAQCYDVLGTTYVRLRVWTGSSEPTTWTTAAGNGVCTYSVSDETYVTSRGGQIGTRLSVPGIANGPITVKLNVFQYAVLDIDQLTADDSDTNAGTYNYAPATTTGVTQGPFATLARALRDVPAYNQATVILSFCLGGPATPADGITGVVQESVNLVGIQGGGKLIITGPNPYWLGSLYIVGCNHDIIVSGITFSDPGGSQDSTTLNINLSRYVEVYQCIFEGNTTNAVQNVMYQQGSCGIITNCQLHGASTYCLNVASSSYVFAQAMTGGATNSYRVTGSILQAIGTVPTGGFAAGTSALIITNGTGSTKTDISSVLNTPTTGGGSAPTGSSKKSKTWNATKGGTYGMAYGTWAAGDVTQGAYGGSQNHKGMWQLPANLFSTLSGKTMDSGYITVTRRGYGGSSGAQGIFICTYTTNVEGSGSAVVLSGPTSLGSLAWGQTKTFAIPAGILTDLNGGTQRGIGIFQADGQPYVIMSPNAKVKVTYH
jgi:hypothetical protein